MICFAYPMVWMNERKLVKVYKTIALGREACVEANPDEPSAENNHKLVHAKGTLAVTEALVDEQFGLAKEGLVKLRRNVEVYQWVEEEETYESDGETKSRKVYHQRWVGHRVSSATFEVQQDGNNPEHWPFEDHTMVNPSARLGAYKVSESQLAMLNDWKQMGVDGDFETIAGAAGGALQNGGWAAPQLYHGYVYARLAHHVEYNLDVAELGDIRVKWEMVECSDVTFVSQQMQDGEGEYTFRNWNPEKEDVAWGESTAQDVDIACPWYCLPCFITECCFKVAFQETIDYVRGGLHKMDQCFDYMEEEN